MIANRWLTTALLATFLLTACSGVPEQPAPTPTPTPSPTADSGDFDPLGPIPPGDPQLKASDPNAASLANGQPTLVEFFAFW